MHIAKFPKPDESDLEDVGAWEHVALTLASRAGVTVPHTRLLRVKGRAVLLLERFDRAGESRVPYISGLTAVQGEDGGNYSYLELVAFLEEQGAQPEHDIRELWRRMLFNCAIGNTDDHMRNHGFLRTRGGWNLAPAFDINPTAGDHQKHLRTALDFDTREADPKAAMAVCEHFRTSLADARSISRTMAGCLREWRTVAQRNGISQASIDNMASCFEKGIAELELAAQSR